MKPGACGILSGLCRFFPGQGQSHVQTGGGEDGRFVNTVHVQVRFSAVGGEHDMRVHI